MSCRLFIHDFFQDGRLDVLAEIRVMQVCGQWTKEKRAAWIKEAVATHARLRQTHPGLYPGVSYFAGRVAALKSGLTASCSEPGKRPEQTACLMVYRPLSPNSDRFCGLFDCGDEALWGVSFRGDAQPFVLLCDVCRQEWERSETAYITVDGWDWDCDEDLLPFPMVQPTKLAERQKDATVLGETILPCAFLVGFDLSDILWPTSHLMMITQLIIVVCVRWQSARLIRLLFDLHRLMQGNNEQF